MAKNRLEIQFNGYDQLQKRLKEINGNAKQAAESALKASHSHVTRKLKSAVQPHRQTGKTEFSLRETPVVEWTGTVAEDKIGFNISEGGLPSIFLMYGTPSIEPDKNLYNAVYGSQTRKEIQNLQREVYEKSIERTMKKNES